MKYTYFKRSIFSEEAPIQVLIIMEDFDENIKIDCGHQLITLDDNYIEDNDLAAIISQSVEIQHVELLNIAKLFPNKFTPREKPAPASRF